MGVFVVEEVSYSSHKQEINMLISCLEGELVNVHNGFLLTVEFIDPDIEKLHQGLINSTEMGSIYPYLELREATPLDWLKLRLESRRVV